MLFLEQLDPEMFLRLDCSSWTSAATGLTEAGNFSFPMDVDEGDF
jgi:hypothetical protein